MIATCVLLRGLGREAGHWGDFLPSLRRALPDCDVVTLDLPGTGSRLHDRAPFTIRETADSVRDDAISRGLTQHPMLVFGISLGGIVAMEWAGRHPEDVAGLVVAASSASDLSPRFKRFSPWGHLVVALNLLTRDPERRHRRLARLTLNRVDLREPFIKLCLQLERERPVAPATVQAQFDAATNWRSPSALQVPSLFLVGGRDRLVHRDCMRALAGRYAAPLEEHPDAGHDLTTDAHDWVAEHLARFRERIAARS